MLNLNKNGLICPIAIERSDGRWDDSVVYHIYCTDNLEELPVLILEQMRDHINSVIDKKSRV